MKQWPLAVSALLAILMSTGILALALTFSYLRYKTGFLEHTTALQRRIESNFAELADPAEQGSAFYQAMPRILGDDFRLFSERIMGRFSFVSGLLFAPLVTTSERGAFEKSWQEEGLVTFSIHDSMTDALSLSADREAYLPVLYIEPLHPEYASLLGLDIGNRNDFKGVFSQAARTDKTLMVDNPGLLHQTREFWLARAVYRGRAAVQSDESRTADAAGMILLKVDPAAVVESVLKEADKAQVGLCLLIDNGDSASTDGT